MIGLDKEGGDRSTAKVLMLEDRSAQIAIFLLTFIRFIVMLGKRSICMRPENGPLSKGNIDALLNCLFSIEAKSIGVSKAKESGNTFPFL